MATGNRSDRRGLTNRSTSAELDLDAADDAEADWDAVRAAAPDLAAVAQLTERDDFRGLLITAQAADPDSEYDFVSRFFAPAHGIGEDPVTGSAHTGLAPYWAARLRQEQLVGFQASARGGLVRIAMAGDRVYLTGRAVTIIDATCWSDAVTHRRRPGSSTTY